MAPAKPRAGSPQAATARGAKGTAKNGAAGNAKNGNAAKNGVAKNGAAKNGATKNGASQNGAPKNGATSVPAPAKAARAATPPRAKSGPDAARPVPSGATAGRRPAPARTGSPRAKTVSAAGVSGRGSEPDPPEVEYGRPAAWLRWTTFLLALAGLGVSIYLTYAHYTESALAGCTETGAIDCTKVTTSAQSVVFGIPVAVLGLAFYVFMVAIMNPWAWLIRRREVGLLRLASLVVGIGFVLYLIYAELFDIGSICLYCTSVHVITFLLFVLTGLAAAIWGVSPQAQLRQRQPSR